MTLSTSSLGQSFNVDSFLSCHGVMLKDRFLYTRLLVKYHLLYSTTFPSSRSTCCFKAEPEEFYRNFLLSLSLHVKSLEYFKAWRQNMFGTITPSRVCLPKQVVWKDPIKQTNSSDLSSCQGHDNGGRRRLL